MKKTKNKKKLTKDEIICLVLLHAPFVMILSTPFWY